MPEHEKVWEDSSLIWTGPAKHTNRQRLPFDSATSATPVRIHILEYYVTYRLIAEQIDRYPAAGATRQFTIGRSVLTAFGDADARGRHLATLEASAFIFDPPKDAEKIVMTTIEEANAADAKGGTK